MNRLISVLVLGSSVVAFGQADQQPPMPQLVPFVYGHDRDLPLSVQGVGSTDFHFVDWDGDGRVDMIFRGRGGLRLAKNIGTPQVARFENPHKSAPVLLGDERVGRFLALTRRPGVAAAAEDGPPAFFSVNTQDKVTDMAKVDLNLNLFTPKRTVSGTTWTVTQALDRSGKPYAWFGDTWMCPAITAADVNGDGKDDLIVGLSHPSKTQPTGNFVAGYNNPQDSWNPQAARLYLLINESADGKLIFGPPQMIMADAKPIIPFGIPYPVAADMDGDGLVDLVVGQHKPGMLLFKNVGTKQEPRFTDRGMLCDPDGKPIQSILAVHPHFGDLNGDGKPELVASTYFGCTFNFRVFSQAAAPEVGGMPRWKPDGLLMMAGDKNMIVQPQGIGTIEPIDFNGDGKLDLVLGSEPCAPSVVINEGTNANPVWSVRAPLRFTDGSAVEYYPIEHGLGSVWGPIEWYVDRCTPRLRDWDGDGIVDMLTGSMGLRQLFLKGKIVDGELRFEKPMVFTVNGKPLAAAQRVQPAGVDFNGDGHLDLVALDDHNVLNVWAGNGTTELGSPQPCLDEKGSPIQIKTRILDIGHGRSSVEAVDWDLDGKLDLLVYLGFDRRRGGIYYYHASDKSLKFDKAVRFSPHISFHNGGISVADLDGDGLLDVFTGGDNTRADVDPKGQLFWIRGRDLPVPPATRPVVIRGVTTSRP